MQLLLMETDGFLYAHSVFLRAAIEIISHIHSKIIQFYFSFSAEQKFIRKDVFSDALVIKKELLPEIGRAHV